MLLTGLAILCFAVAIIILGIAALVVPESKNATVAIKRCETEQCRDFVHWVGLEMGSNPCEDFASFVCSNFRKLLDIDIGFVYELAVRNARHHERLLEGGRDTFDITKAAAMFKSCSVRTEDEAQASRKFHDFMTEQKLFWPDVTRHNASGLKVATILVDLAVNWILPLWFNVVLIPASGAIPRFIYVTPSYFGKVWYPLHNYTLVGMVSYKIYWELFISSLLPKYRVNVSSRTVNEIRDTHGYILERLFISASRSHPEPIHFKLKHVQDNYKHMVAEDWVDALQNAFRAKPSINSDDHIYFTDKYLLNITNNFLEMYSEETLLAQISWWTIQIIGSVVSKAVTTRLLGEGARDRLRLLCTFEVESVYALLLAATDVTSKFTPEDRTYIDSFLNGIVRATIKKIRSAAWIEINTKKALVLKLQKLTTTIWPSQSYLTEDGLRKAYEAFPEAETTFFDFWISGRRALRSLLDSGKHREAYTFPKRVGHALLQYNYVANDVSVYLASLSAPFYYPRATKTMSYSGIGSLYAKELVRSLDPYATCFDSVINKLAESNTLNEYISKVSCPSPVPPTNLCPPNSSEGIFPHVPALEVLYSAYLEDVNHTQELGMWKMEKFSPEQIFFIGTCFSSCHGGQTEDLESCNSAMRNFAPFSQAFNCSEGSYMNPPKKCTFF